MKKILKNRIFIFALGILISSSISVLAQTYFPSNDITYDNTQSGLSSNNVQGAIDELYNTCINPPTPEGGEGLLDNVDIVSSGDGLYVDEYETGKYTYKGGNPNNYVTFNGEEAGWRIVSINPDKTIKIMRIDSLVTKAWDDSSEHGDRNWARPASLNTYLNDNYYNRLSENVKKQIVTGTYNIGELSMVGQSAGQRDNTASIINAEKSKTWKGNVALPTVSEVIRACSNTNCNTVNKYGNNYESCENSNWMYVSRNFWWTLSVDRTTMYGGAQVYGYTYGLGSYSANSQGYGARPVVTLSAQIPIISGDGSQSDPFQLGKI